MLHFSRLQFPYVKRDLPGYVGKKIHKTIYNIPVDPGGRAADEIKDNFFCNKEVQFVYVEFMIGTFV